MAEYSQTDVVGLTYVGADALQQEYEVGAEQALSDVERIIGEWLKVGIVEM